MNKKSCNILHFVSTVLPCPLGNTTANCLIEKSFKKQKAVVKGQRTREDKKTKQRFDDRKERLAKGEREKANREASRKRAEDALETGYMRGGAVRKGPEGFKGIF